MPTLDVEFYGENVRKIEKFSSILFKKASFLAISQFAYHFLKLFFSWTGARPPSKSAYADYRYTVILRSTRAEKDPPLDISPPRLPRGLSYLLN